MVTFTDMIGGAGGSSGKDPCKLTIGSSVAASASSSGFSSATGSSSTGIAVSGPHWVFWFSSDPDSDIAAAGSQGAVRSVVWISSG